MLHHPKDLVKEDQRVVPLEEETQVPEEVEEELALEEGAGQTHGQQAGVVIVKGIPIRQGTEDGHLITEDGMKDGGILGTQSLNPGNG